MRKIIFKTLKKMMIGIVGIILLLVIVGALFVHLSPHFGGKHSAQDQERYQASGHYEKGKFVNLVPTKMDMSLSNIYGMLKDFIKGNPNKTPDHSLPMEHLDATAVAKVKEDRLIWFGHSAFLLQIDSKQILLDPMLGKCPAPHPYLGTKRYNDSLPIEIEQLPNIDAIIISHDHYDHLDYASIQALKAKTKEFYVPLGVGAHLRAWGVDSGHIHELNWWDEIEYEALKFVFTPSRHFSGRGVADNSSTLWGSWVIQSENKNIYFSGDGGYANHFKEIGEKYGPFDFAMMECGQYNERWADIHMMPEETAQAAFDVQAKMMMPIHWGAFTLSLHDWNEPVKRVIKKAKSLAIPITIPKIGQVISLDKIQALQEQWWL